MLKTHVQNYQKTPPRKELKGYKSRWSNAVMELMPYGIYIVTYIALPCYSVVLSVTPVGFTSLP